ncbi:MAG: hypothetical protein IGS48_05660 [Oscillatoriales cyanobacterium C42_A2020_001]|nr:hypothetical protein [Leptolyngbyaceae cyanobacterium C42_A2020_001]
MKPLKTALIVCVLLLNVLLVRPALADAGKFIKTPEYAEVTQAIADLKNPEKTTDLAPETIQQKLSNLQFQKYILETAESRSICRNETGKTLGIYTKSKKAALPTISFLGAGQVTDDDVECVGIFLPAGSKVASGNSEGFADPVVAKFVPGTQLTATADPETGMINFNAPGSGFFKTGEIDWAIPTLTQAEVEAQAPNAPVD